MKFSKQSKVSLQSFILTFFAALVLFGLLAWLIYGTVSSKIGGTEKSPNGLEEDMPVSGEVDSSDLPIFNKDDDEIQGESFTLLVAGYNVTGTSLDAMMILDVDKENEKVVLYPINTDAKVYVGYGSVGSVNVRLGDLCRYKDMTYIADKVSAITGIPVDYYVSFTADAFIEAVDKLNEKKVYSYSVQKEMNHAYSEEEELKQYNIEFKRGDKLTSGIDLYNVLRYEGDTYSDKLSRQLNIAEDMVKALVVSQIKDKSPKTVITTFTTLIKAATECKTNIPIETFITEGFELLSSINEFTFEPSMKFKTATLNFK